MIRVASGKIQGEERELWAGGPDLKDNEEKLKTLNNLVWR